MKDTYLDYPTFAGKIEQFECEIYKLDVIYNHADHRCWTAIINPKKDNIIVTYGINKYGPGTRYFDILASEKTMIDVYQDDVYSIIESMLGKGLITTIFKTEE